MCRHQSKDIRLISNQGNKTPLKEHDKAPITGPKDMEIYKLPDI